MNSYLLTVTGTVLFSSIIIAILPSGKTAELIKAIVRTACLAVILSPVADLFGELKKNEGIFVESSIQAHEDFIEYSCNERIKATEKLLKKDLDGRFGGVDSTEIAWVWETVNVGGYSVDEIRIRSVLVKMKTTLTEAQKKEIGEYILVSYGCESSVTLAGER